MLMYYKRSKQCTRNPSGTQLPSSQKLTLSYEQITRSFWWIQQEAKYWLHRVTQKEKELYSQKGLFFAFHIHTQKYFQFVMTLLHRKTPIPRRLLLSTQKMYLLLARRSACNVQSPQKHSLPLGVHQHVSNSLHCLSAAPWGRVFKSVTAVNLPANQPPPTSLISYSKATQTVPGRPPLDAEKVFLLSSQSVNSQDTVGEAEQSVRIHKWKDEIKGRISQEIQREIGK